MSNTKELNNLVTEFCLNYLPKKDIDFVLDNEATSPIFESNLPMVKLKEIFMTSDMNIQDLECELLWLLFDNLIDWESITKELELRHLPL